MDPKSPKITQKQTKTQNYIRHDSSSVDFTTNYIPLRAIPSVNVLIICYVGASLLSQAVIQVSILCARKHGWVLTVINISWQTSALMWLTWQTHELMEYPWLFFIVFARKQYSNLLPSREEYEKKGGSSAKIELCFFFFFFSLSPLRSHTSGPTHFNIAQRQSWSDSSGDVSHFCPLICFCNLQMG